MQDRCEVITIFVFWNALKATENGISEGGEIAIFITMVLSVVALCGIISWLIIDWLENRKR